MPILAHPDGGAPRFSGPQAFSPVLHEAQLAFFLHLMCSEGMVIVDGIVFA